MDAPTARLPQTPSEVWVAGEKYKVVEEMLLALGEEFNLTIWYNGQKIHEAKMEDDHPKAAQS